MNNELYHHGILGQRWGKKNGPPYPLDEKKHSTKEKKEAIKKDLNEIKKSRNDLIKKLKKVKGIHDDIASKLAYMMFVDVNVGKMYTDKRLKTPLYSNTNSSFMQQQMIQLQQQEQQRQINTQNMINNQMLQNQAFAQQSIDTAMFNTNMGLSMATFGTPGMF